MKHNRFCLAFLVTFILLAITTWSLKYDPDEGQRCVYLSASTACDPKTYTTRTYVGPIAGFNATISFTDKVHDAAGLVGYLPSRKAIYVVYRGTTGAKNWMDDLEISKVSYSTWPECNCQVHKGWFNSMKTNIDMVANEVNRLRTKFPDYHVILTGHSMGGAETHLCSMELLKRNIPVYAVYNFGQPRVGDSKYASFANTKVKDFTFRIVHHQDIVPHTPMQALGFQHVCTEMYEPNSVFDGTIKTCGTWDSCGCEDKSCSDQWGTLDLSTDDHVHYLGLYMNCASVSVSL